MKLEPIIGLEIHLELNTKSKLFCSCVNETDPLKPNSNICPICLGHPGVLPVINKSAVQKSLTIGLALEGNVSQESYFDRKNYFYPDLPKGYQISQYKLPLISGGQLEIEVDVLREEKSSPSQLSKKVRRVNLERVHLEEDTAKLLHPPLSDSRPPRPPSDSRLPVGSRESAWSLVDFNRSGIPLLEVVTKPEFRSPPEAKIFLQELQLLARYLDISNADMEHGQMRCDTNISLRPKGSKNMFSKTEIKNLNSFKSVEDSLIYEIKRQTQLWEKNRAPKTQTTRGWDEKRHVTYEQRWKEEEQDYRYFPEPDLPPIEHGSDSIGTGSRALAGDYVHSEDAPIHIDEIRRLLPELPIAKRKRFMRDYGFSLANAKILSSNRSLADFVEKVISEIKAWLISLETVEGTEQEIWDKNKNKLVTLVANWLINRYLPLTTSEKEFPIRPENFAEFIISVYEKKVSSTVAQQILEKMVQYRADLDHVISNYQLQTIDDAHELKSIADKVISENPDIVEKFKKGKTNVIQYLVGQVMKKTKGQADPAIVRELLER
ncbi:Asp-tRNA(Asn)/Glu-tRNA(Gln) amidotransferase subunit GatB, partial [Patescibacteria group bacterium AH-259-L07]|nr:Asp-tRNA(Asn)/Glu-tRNA(Gln) amidotransferase subunit GatB [Patescibacteria group bacterium AH-259-L07]